MITIIDYGIGNLGSVANALSKLGAKYQVSGDPYMLQKSDALILPGVGSAKEGMENLRKRKLDKILISEIKREKPFLGICLGMQLLFESSEEGNVQCLNILQGKVKRFQKMRKVPQIGWNEVNFKQFNLPDRQAGNLAIQQLTKNISNNSYFYFVNSYFCIPKDNSIIAGETEYGERFASIIVKENIIATQFHPEKSGQVGFQLLKTFINFATKAT